MKHHPYIFVARAITRGVHEQARRVAPRRARLLAVERRPRRAYFPNDPEPRDVDPLDLAVYFQPGAEPEFPKMHPSEVLEAEVLEALAKEIAERGHASFLYLLFAAPVPDAIFEAFTFTESSRALAEEHAVQLKRRVRHHHHAVPVPSTTDALAAFDRNALTDALIQSGGFSVARPASEDDKAIWRANRKAAADTARAIIAVLDAEASTLEAP